MATSFGSDPPVATQVAGTLSSVADELAAGATTFYSVPRTTAVPQVDAALDTFWSQTSNYRTATDELVSAAATMLRSLADGSTATDHALATQVPVPTDVTSSDARAAEGRLARG